MLQHAEAQVFLEELLLAQQDMPFEPELLKDLFSQTSAQSTESLENIARTLSKGAGLATRVLAMANSAYYGLQSEVSSIERAVAVLGLKEVRNLVLSIGIAGMTEERDFPAGFDKKEYWRHQVAVGIIARLLAEYSGQADPDTMYTAGLLHDLGKLFIAAYRPDVWTALKEVKESSSSAKTDVDVEDAYWGLDHAVIAGHVLSYWNLPQSLTEPINWHHAPHLAGDFKRSATIVHVADALLHRTSGEGIPLPDAAKKLLAMLIPDNRRETFRAELKTRLDSEQIDSLVHHLV